MPDAVRNILKASIPLWSIAIIQPVYKKQIKCQTAAMGPNLKSIHLNRNLSRDLSLLWRMKMVIKR